MSKYDCDTTKKYCNVCDPTGIGDGPCTGVIGGAQLNGQAGQYGALERIMLHLRATDSNNDSDITCSSKDGTNLGWYKKSGACGKPITSTNNSKKMRTMPLTVGNSNNSTKNKGVSEEIRHVDDWATFPLQALHKVWGDGSGKEKFNRGVNCRNVTISSPGENVYFTGFKKGVRVPVMNTTQNVVKMETHGDNYTGNVHGLTSTKGTICPVVSEHASGTRVGGVACTREQFGGGVYNILCYVPKTSDNSSYKTKNGKSYNMNGRGYTFAAWTFHYEEIYNGPKGTPPNNSNNSQARGNLTGAIAPVKFPCYNVCDGGKADNQQCATTCTGGDGDKDLYSTINHEIDIEIPCNSPQFEWGTEMTWDTMNCNTWVNDIDNYDVDTGAYYTQVAVKNKKANFISRELESSTAKDYHWYTIDWYVDNDDPTGKHNYVKFYFDDPFDPDGKTKDPKGNLLPKKPSGSKINDGSSYGLVHSTQRFVPTRAGRFNVGPWMSWWGYNATHGGKPLFNTATVRMAQLSIIPYQKSGFNFPQNYDQITPDGDTECDFHDLYSIKPPLPPGPPGVTPGPPGVTPGPPGVTPGPPGVTPGPGPKPGPGHHQQNLLWLWILLSVLGVLGIGVLIFVYSKKKNKRKRRKK